MLSNVRVIKRYCDQTLWTLAWFTLVGAVSKVSSLAVTRWPPFDLLPVFVVSESRPSPCELRITSVWLDCFSAPRSPAGEYCRISSSGTRWPESGGSGARRRVPVSRLGRSREKETLGLAIHFGALLFIIEDCYGNLLWKIVIGEKVI